ncbi:nucleotide exchange factor sil1 [Dimargaris verticillata]|uniref:Nucleotide exchange factor sil1 n=1 Tax=Dimargaris verticillata TaxID=2761393 RepID=A0A9W8B088_9FUNG|nr:nucleotide exchange factor sil1 [Dimargaris verticillata]
MTSEKRTTSQHRFVVYLLAIAAFVGVWYLWTIPVALRSSDEATRPTEPIPRPPLDQADTKDEICQQVDGILRCEPRLFQATHDFKPILKGQQLPKGLHVKVNMQTGQQYAKLVDPTAPDTAHDVILVPEEEPQAPADGSNAKTSHPVKVLGVEQQAIGHALTMIAQHQPNGTAPNSTLLLETLVDLTSLVSTWKHGSIFVQQRGLAKVTPLLTPENDPDVVQQAALVIKNAAQNNPPVQEAALASGLIDTLIATIGRTKNIRALDRLVYALAAVVRGHTPAVELFRSHHGIHELALLYDKTRDARLRHRCAVLISDVFNPTMVPTPVTVSDTEDRHDIEHWCWNLGSSFVNASSGAAHQDVDWKNTLLKGVVNLNHHFPRSCRLDCHTSSTDLDPPCPYTTLAQVLASETAKAHNDADYSDYQNTLTKVRQLMAA